MMKSPPRRLYGVTYRDGTGRARHVRILATSEQEASDHAARTVIGFASLERVCLVTNDPFAPHPSTLEERAK